MKVRRIVYVCLVVVALAVVITVTPTLNSKILECFKDVIGGLDTRSAAAMTIADKVDAFVAFQNKNRGLADEMVALDFNALAGAGQQGQNAVSGISGIGNGAANISFSGGFNAIVLDGGHSVQASPSSPDNYAVSVDANGNVTLLDENTGQSQTVSGLSYLVFNGGAQNNDGSYRSIEFIASGNNALVAAIYNAALGRQPDLPGLEYYAARVAAGVWSLHEVATNFLASPEFQKLFPATAQPPDNGGPNDQAYITTLYQNILHRTPAASEMGYYVEDLQGTLPGIAQQDRAQLLINFAASPENQGDVSGWLINTSNGVHMDAGYGAPGSQPATMVLSARAGGLINTALIDPSSLTGVTVVNGGLAHGGVVVNPATSTLQSGEAGITIYLSATLMKADISLGDGDTVFTAPAGGAVIAFSGLGGTVNFEGTNDAVLSSGLTGTNLTGSAPPVALVINGFNTGDFVQFGHLYAAPAGANFSPTIVFIPAPPVGSMVQGNSYVNQFGKSAFALYVGALSDTSAATMAAAAAKLYVPSNQSGGWPDIIDFYGQGPTGDTVIYQWQADNTHQVTAATMQSGVELIGFPPSQITAATLHP